eukprot:5939800-Amphidinium_carterae.2
MMIKAVLFKPSPRRKDEAVKLVVGCFWGSVAVIAVPVPRSTLALLAKSCTRSPTCPPASFEHRAIEAPSVVGETGGRSYDCRINTTAIPEGPCIKSQHVRSLVVAEESYNCQIISLITFQKHESSSSSSSSYETPDVALISLGKTCTVSMIMHEHMSFQRNEKRSYCLRQQPAPCMNPSIAVQILQLEHNSPYT